MALNLKNCEPRLRDRIMAQLSQEDAAKKPIQQPMFPQIKVGKRIRQGEKPPNKLEADWRRQLEAMHPDVKFRAQAIRFRLANGAWYKPDLMAWLNCRVVCWETKGPKQMKGVARGMLTVKVAAATWPEVLFILVWRDKNGWQQQEVQP